MRESLQPRWGGVIAGVLAGLAWTAAKVSIPLLVKAAIDRGIDADNTTALVVLSVLIAVTGVVQGVFTGLRRYLAFQVARAAERDLRDSLFAHLQRLHFAYHDQAQTGQLMSRANTDL